jgi:type II secretory pathway pseudopilin PulG
MTLEVVVAVVVAVLLALAVWQLRGRRRNAVARRERRKAEILRERAREHNAAANEARGEGERRTGSWGTLRGVTRGPPVRVRRSRRAESLPSGRYPRR